jgi:hypothetical protein
MCQGFETTWPYVPSGEITIENQNFTVQSLYIAKYLVTYRQFQVFLDANDGFNNDEWWQDLHKDGFKQAMNNQLAQYPNYPRDTVSWYQSMAFTRWLNHHLQGQQFSPENAPDRLFTVGDNLEIRLPTEWEWQFAASGGSPQNKYPWGEWDGRRANTTEAGLGNRATAVGMYPDGAAARSTSIRTSRPSPLASTTIRATVTTTTVFGLWFRPPSLEHMFSKAERSEAPLPPSGGRNHAIPNKKPTL